MQEVKLVEVGSVVSVVGNVSIISAEGQKRTLKVGDKVSPGDIILTSSQAKVLVHFDGHTEAVAIEPSCAACIAIDSDNNPIAHSQEIAGDTLALEHQSVEQLQQLILAGVDPTSTSDDEITNLQELIEKGIDPTSVDEFEAAAAGETGNQGSSTSPKIDATIEEVQVTAGFDTSYAAGAVQSVTPSDDDNAPRPAIISGDDQGIAIEDLQTVINGKLDIIDTNADEAQFLVDSIETQYGVFTIDADGNWQFQLNNELAVIQSLDEGESLFESVTVTSIDGTEHTINLEIQGSEDLSVVILADGDTDVGSVTEDVAVNTENQLTTSGHLTVTDVDSNDNPAFDPNSVTSTDTLGVLTIDAEGNWHYSIDNTLLAVQSLDDGESFTETFTVFTIDGQSHEITVTVNGSDDLSVISLEFGDTDVGSVTEDVVVNTENQLTTSGHLTVTDMDTSDSPAFDPNSVISTDTLGVLTIDAEGNWHYSIDNTLSAVQSLDDGESFTETFTVFTIDGQSHEITVTVNGTDDLSVISLELGDSDVGSVTEDIAVDAENQLTTSGHLTVTDVDANDNPAFDPNSVTSTDTLGVLTIDAEGNWNYSIDNTMSAVQSLDDGESFTETFIVFTIDGQSHEITVTVNGTDDLSVISLELGDTDVGSVTEDVAVNTEDQLTTSGHLTVTDVDTSDSPAFDPNTVTSTDTLGVLTIDAEGNWHYSIDNTLSAVQSLGEGDSFIETFTVFTIDGQSHEITVTVNGTNDGPQAIDDNISLEEDSSAVVIDVLANDSDLDGDSLTVTAVTQPTHGTVTLVNGVVTYIPEPNFNGVVTFTYTISDGNGGTDTATVTLTVNAQNDDPVAVDDIVSLNEDDGATVIDVLANDSDLDGDSITVTAVTQPAHGTVTLVNGVVTYIPEPNFNGVVTFTYTISDGNGGTDTATVTLTVNAQNDDPVAVDDIISLNEDDGATVIDVLANDSDLDGDSLTVTAVTQPTHGTVTLVNGVVTYIPEPNFNGVVTFTYTISDGNGGTDTATVTLTVNGQNDEPLAVDDIVSINEDDDATVIDVLANDTDLDRDSLSVTSVTQPTHGTVTLVNGVVTYIPEPNFNGVVTFTYTISDGNGGTDTATVTVTVNPQGDITVVADDTATVDEDSA
ncbi:retention module-containing protein, partial [Litorilituus lipolyticus]